MLQIKNHKLFQIIQCSLLLHNMKENLEWITIKLVFHNNNNNINKFRLQHLNLL